MPTVKVFAPQLSGTTGFALWLRKTSDQSLVNAGGDALTESSTSGWFSATVSETWTERLSAAVIDADGLVPQSGWLGVGETVVADVLTGSSELDSATLGKIDAILEDTGTTLPAAIAAIDTGGSGSGARTVTITVNDGTTVLQNATIRLTEGANTFTAQTNVSGVAVFNLDDATYTVGITKSGYSYAGTTLVVDGTETRTYSMTAISITLPDNPELSAIVVTCLGIDFEIESGITIDLRIKTLPNGSTNTAYPGLKQTATSNVNGIATLYAPKGSVCEWKRGRADVWNEITVGTGDQTNVTSIIGSP